MKLRKAADEKEVEKGIHILQEPTGWPVQPNLTVTATVFSSSSLLAKCFLVFVVIATVEKIKAAQKQRLLAQKRVEQMEVEEN